ncbi:response regulator [Clostridium sp. MSJ-11]|uniref:Response regulator n=1 Tax=Clostridium mobile TaxID=2841512 RepID=A0ABS6EEM6_9CLOT|nr:response regulator [Clostridium mobile]MBU5483232.1 response regulator [Clostridium mobile]
MRTIIVEDEKPILELMKMLINKNKHLKIIGEFSNPKEALENILKLLPEVIFIDVEMPYMSGIEFAKKVMSFDENIQIVFVTAHEKYALEAFKVNAVNYILKPITEEDLNVTVSRLLKNRNIQEINLEEDKENKIFCLGGFRVYGSLGNEIIKWSTAKVQELFAYFVYKNGEEIDKWELCDILWPDSPPKKAEHNLHSTIYRLKSVFKNTAIDNIVHYRSGKYRIDLEDFRCDVWDFQAFIENNPVVNEKNIMNYEKIIDSYKGILFGNEDYIWTIELNEKISRYYLTSAKNIAKYYTEKNFYYKAEEYLDKVIKKNPFDEEAHELMMKVYFNIGNRVELVSHYKRLNKLFKDELRIPPKESTKKLYENLLVKL